MKLESFVGIAGEVLTIQKPTDLYPALDWIQSLMMDFVNDGHPDATTFEHCANLISTMMQTAEQWGFGSMDDVDKIEY